MPNILAALLAENPILLTGLDLLVKSTIVLLFTLAASRLVKAESFHVRNQHLLWMAGLICLALMPIAGAIARILNTEANIQTTILTLPIPLDYTPSTNTASLSTFLINNLLLAAYLIPCLLLLARMIFAVASVFGIGLRAAASSNKQALDAVAHIAKKLDISRPVTVLQSREITSPFSFGVFKPKIILPYQANGWAESMLEDVLVHELTHIRRLDWPSILLCHLIVSLYWMNPLSWIAIRKLSEEAENSCDSAVLSFGKNSTDYAKNLMLIARQSRDGNRILTQMMADNRMLSKRVQLILKGNTNIKVNKTFLPIFTGALFSMVVVFGNIQLFSVQPLLQDRPESLESLTPAPSFVVTPRFGTF